MCPCGELFSLSHSLQCYKGGYTQMRHNEIGDMFASVGKEVYDVEIEPKLQPFEGESFFFHKTTTTEDEVRLDIKANELWDTFLYNFFRRSLEHVPKMSTRHITSKNLKRNSNTSSES